jgi:Peptidase family M1 domain
MTGDRTQAHSSNRKRVDVVTEVIGKQAAQGFLIFIVAVACCAFAQTPPPSADPVSLPPAATPSATGPARELYLQLRRVGLNPAHAYKIRGATLDRPGLHLTFEDGLIAFTQDVQARITGALFDGDGEVLLTPPSREERASMALGTGMAILEERFSSAYLRFNDDTFADLQPSLRAASDAADFAARFESTAENLAELDAIRLFTTFSRFLPVNGKDPTQIPPLPGSSTVPDHYLHVRVEGENLGPFDIHYDSLAFEQLSAGKSTEKDGVSYYDVWTSFSPAVSEVHASVPAAPAPADDVLKVDSYRLNAEVRPPTDLTVDATLQVKIQASGDRAVLFELSRFLQVKQVEINGQVAEFINNPALEGTQLARRGNDLVAVVFPQTLRKDDVFTLRFLYGGAVLSEAGGGLLYVGARGDWYPNRNLSTASFDLTFRYPPGWTLIATGNRVSGADDANQPPAETTSPSTLEARWKTDRPIALAGFNLGKYVKASAQAGPVQVETYAARGVEKDFPRASDPLPPLDPRGITPPPNLPAVSSSPSPAKHAQAVANEAAQAVEFFVQRFGPFPYPTLSLTQMPGSISQGWPGLIFLSSLSFLSSQEAEDLHFNPARASLRRIVLAHETAHQWWGDLVLWKSYRDQWIVEALANYSALMKLETENPAEYRAVLEQYRKELLTKNKDGKTLQEAGPVTLGQRLTSSQFPNGYEAVSYGRGTWLFHMLRYMLLDAESPTNRLNSREEPFTRILRSVAERYAGRAIDTHELIAAFAENLPRSLQFEGKQSLDWFEQGWVEGTALPEFSIRNLKLVPKENAITVSGVLLQKNAPPELVTSVPLYAAVGHKNVFLARVLADGPDTNFHLTAPAGTRGILIDPNGTLLTGGRQ